jgi:hypothetical protein
MKEDRDTGAYDGGGLKGPLYWLAGVTSAMALKAVSGPGGLLGGLLGGAPLPPPVGPAAPVTREVLNLTTENQGLKSQLYTNTLNAQQSVWNATQQGRIDCLQRQVDEIRSMTRLTIPNGNVSPGWGPAVVAPAPAPAAAQGGTDAATIAAVVAAVLDAQKETA